MKEEVLNILNLSDDYADSRKERRKGKKATNEFFTPYELVVKMCDKVPVEKWSDPKATFLDPCAGNGQFVLEIIRRRYMDYHIDIIDIMKTLYVTELMQDNVDEMKKRIFKLLDAMDVTYKKEEISAIMNNNIICTDFFKWDYENWCSL